MNKKDQSKSWVTSTEAMKLAKIKSCDLMHYRQDGKLEYIKKGNAYLYSSDSIKGLKNPPKK